VGNANGIVPQAESPSSLNVPETHCTLYRRLLTLSLQKTIVVFRKFRASFVYTHDSLLSIQHKNERHGGHQGESKALCSNKGIKKPRKVKFLTQGHAERAQSVVQE